MRHQIGPKNVTEEPNGTILMSGSATYNTPSSQSSVMGVKTVQKHIRHSLGLPSLCSFVLEIKVKNVKSIFVRILVYNQPVYFL